MRKVWKTKEFLPVSQDIIDAAGSKILARLLLNRGIDTPCKIKNFLNPLGMTITHPDVFTDMEKSVERIKKAIERQECITVYGDFDADGITSTSVLFKTLKTIGANVDYYLPNRETESHGLNTKALINIISKKKSKLIITVDCAISDVAEVKFAKGFGADIIITDHHEAPDELPPAFAILNPKAKNALKDELSVEELENLNYLAGVGVAFKLACALLEEFQKEDFINEIIPLVALGTIADVVPLIGENRCFVEMGLILIRNSRHKGLDKLLKSAGVTKLETVNTETIAFSVAPRINAAGRLDTAEKAFNLLVADDETEIDAAVEALNSLNSERQLLCDETYNQATAMIERNPDLYEKSIILFNETWHIGVIGIVASKLIEKYNVPVFLMTKDDYESQVIRCSCRSISGVNVYDVLSVHSDLFLGFGGHSMAAGFSFDEKVISFESFRTLLDKTVAEVSEGLDLTPIIEVDMEIDPSEVDENLICEIEKMQPFGAQNQPPIFALKNLKLSQYKMMGQTGNHLKLFAAAETGKIFECVKWNMPDFSMPLNSALDLAFYPKLNHFNGNTTIQLDLKDIKSEFLKEKTVQKKSKYSILDHRKKTNVLTQVMDYISTSTKAISLYIESKKSIDELSLPDDFQDLVFDRSQIPEDLDQIMFFDCPPSLCDLKKVICSSGAKTIHLMNFDVNPYPHEDFIRMLSGMIRYSHKNKDGILETDKIAVLLGVTIECVDVAIQLFVSSKMIDAKLVEENKYKIFFKDSVEFSKLKEREEYKLLSAELVKVESFKREVKSSSLEDIQSLLI